MISYELAKELKKRGYPQENLYRETVYYENNGESLGVILGTLGNLPPTKGMVKAPTLEELIEACKDKYYKTKENNFPFLLCLLQKGRKTESWIAGFQYDGDVNGPFRYEGHGKTPAEAVAHLWLALNKKKNTSSE